MSNFQGLTNWRANAGPANTTSSSKTVTRSDCVVFLSFAKHPILKTITEGIGPAQVYSLTRLAPTTDDKGNTTFVVRVTFVHDRAAVIFKARFDNGAIRIEGATVKYIPSETAEFKSTVLASAKDRDVRRELAIWKPKALFSEDFIKIAYANAKEDMLLGPNLPFNVNDPAAVPGLGTTFSHGFMAAFDPPPISLEEMVRVQRFCRPPEKGGYRDSHFGLLIEFTSIEKSVEIVETMKRNGQHKTCFYEFLRDTYEKGYQGRVLGPSHACRFGEEGPKEDETEDKGKGKGKFQPRKDGRGGKKMESWRTSDNWRRGA